MYTIEQLRDEAVIKCLNELYEASQPSITFEDLKKDPDGYRHHYLSQDAQNSIIEKYIEAYGLESNFIEHCDLLISDATNGYSIDKYIKPEGNRPGYRSYDKMPSLSEQIGEEAFKKVIEFLENRKDFYRFDRKADQFKFTVWNYGPSTSKKHVIEYWKSQGKDIEIKDLDPKYNYERYWLGYTEEDIKREEAFNNE